MSNVQEFWEETIKSIKINSNIDGISENEEFMNFASQILYDAEEIMDEITYCHFEGTKASNKKKIQLDGYYFEESDNTLSLYIIPTFEYNDTISTLTNEETNRLFSRLENFVIETKYILETAEESQPAYGFAYDLQKLYRDVTKYKFNIITEKIKTRNLSSIQSKIINDKIAEYNIWDIQRLFLLNQSQRGKIDLDINLSDLDSKPLPCLLANKTEVYESYLCNISGETLAKLYNKYGARLLEGNVRSFLQVKGNVNKGIRTTILKEPENFFTYNNGIAATASSVKIINKDGQSFISQITGLQIVNGGQTTASLAMSYLYDRREHSIECIQKISVPMKLTVVSHEIAQELIPNIARFANSQNKVSDADLWSNHPFHIYMEELSRKIIAPATQGNQFGTYWFYERARGQYKQQTYKASESEKRKFDLLYPSKQKITKSDLAKYQNIRMQQPYTASLGAEKSFGKFSSWMNEEWIKNKNNFNENFFKEIVVIAIIFKYVDSTVKKNGYEYKANINAYTISYLLYLIQQQFPDLCFDYKTVWAKQEISESTKQQINLLIPIVYETLTYEERPVINVTEWAKRNSCWDKLKENNVPLSNDFVKELTTLDLYKSEKRDAKRKQNQINIDNAMIEVANYKNWNKLLEWNSIEKKLSETELSFINLTQRIKQGKFPTDKQCIRIIQILNRAREEGFLD